eukprot:11841838-Alexandrium_andersonii.AAC.1
MSLIASAADGSNARRRLNPSRRRSAMTHLGSTSEAREARASKAASGFRDLANRGSTNLSTAVRSFRRSASSTAVVSTP